MIRKETKDKVIRLYKEGVPITEICALTGIKSSYTIYKILNDANVSPHRNTGAGRKCITISIDDDTENIINEAHPHNISVWVCNIIKNYYKSKDSL